MESTPQQAPKAGIGKGTLAFFAVLALLFILRLGLPFVGLAPAAIIPVNILLTLLFVGLPIIALYRVGSDTWTVRNGVVFLVSGIVIQAVGVMLRGASPPESFGMHFGEALAQLGLPIWCVGLGALLAILLKEANLIPPVAIFLAGFDMLAIFWPDSPTQRILAAHPQIFRNVAASVPSLTGAPMAYVGPADFFFLAMFFIALFRFRMKTQQTFRWVVAVLLAYIGIVIAFGSVQIGPISLGMLPALVPIGLCVLLVNLDAFNLNREEKWMTLAVAVLSVGMAVFALTRPRPLAAPSTSAGDQGVPGPVGMPVPKAQD
ncbi:MAG: hypothetical protein HONBIEJF_02913 [Fimbriimonadaceae bacterium]|nr:hypothetical protein [Fimbriimonadaceae bacterium]